MKLSTPPMPSLSKHFTRFFTALTVFISRLDLLPGNISPLGSFGFFGKSPILYGLSIVAFDVLVKGSYRGFWLTYLGFACYPILGYLARRSTKLQLALLPLASFLFFVLSNFGVWFYWHDHTFAQLVICYTQAVPFYARTLASDMLFGYGYVAARQIWRKHHATICQILNVPTLAPTKSTNS